MSLKFSTLVLMVQCLVGYVIYHLVHNPNEDMPLLSVMLIVNILLMIISVLSLVENNSTNRRF